ncbi:hypothetical protein AGDE_14326 [Angomonas deanei]|uniref:Nucleoporin Nup133/Nup155-like N-terminal domain-containing protein n=1 Tax=Angomonas deanei TaxID=59799 RepID=A0A7G2CGQ7_9TRYP|nr:hypothetical protein AGDE_14326 [Angomonas deanei]CAD2218064.1 hypothetical protein, conserved [Angomonas deanei]|eukprot:EPY21037.1 hypothetical protein AGDE_14326 [Angomonas deanei]
MNASYEDTVREYECAPSECVHCFVATAIGVWWCSTHRQLFFWDREAEEPLNLLELPEVPSLLAATDEGGLLTVGVSHATLYQLHIVEEEDEESGETSIAYEVETVGTVTCSVQGAVTAELYSDGSIAAVTTADGLVLLNFSLFLSPEERSRDEEVSVSFSCEAFFQSPQCARCCFLAPDRLALISATNHLVVVTPDFRQRQVGLERDGQMIVLGPHVPLSMSCHDNVLVVGLSDGTVRLIQASTLKVFKTFDIIKELEAVVSAGTTADANPKPWQIRKKNVSQQILDKKSPSAQVNFHPVVESTAVGDRLITVATPDAVVLIVKDSLEIDKSCISFVHDLPFYRKWGATLQ